jgi:hypothetical protein
VSPLKLKFPVKISAGSVSRRDLIPALKGSPNDLQKRRAVSPLKIKILSKNLGKQHFV